MSLNVKKKLCSQCNDMTFIWKNVDGNKLCKKCATGVAIKPNIKTKFIPKHSPKRSKEERLYTAKRIIFISEHNMCEAHIPGICTTVATECHHKKGRIGKDLLDETNWLAVCHSCHDYIENHRDFAMEKGFSMKRIT